MTPLFERGDKVLYRGTNPWIAEFDEVGTVRHVNRSGSVEVRFGSRSYDDTVITPAIVLQTPKVVRGEFSSCTGFYIAEFSDGTKMSIKGTTVEDLTEYRCNVESVEEFVKKQVKKKAEELELTTMRDEVCFNLQGPSDTKTGYADLDPVGKAAVDELIRRNITAKPPVALPPSF